MIRFILVASLTATSIGACKRYRTTDPGFVSTGSSLKDPSECSGTQQLVPQENSTLQWEATRVKVSTGEETRIVGSNRVKGIWKIRDNKIQDSSAEFRFDAASTDSLDSLRDDRIMNVVFGLAQKAPFQFTIDSLNPVGDAKLAPGSAIEMRARGTLEVYGQKANIAFPLVVKQQGSVFTVTPKGLIYLNVRPKAKEENVINLSSQVDHMLSFVTDVAMKDQVSIDFNLHLKNVCPDS